MNCSLIGRIATASVATLAGVASLSLVCMAFLNAASGMLADDAIYLLMADWFADVVRSGPASTSFVWRHSQFPPLYPMVLGLLGGSTSEVGYAHALTAAMSVVGAAAAYAWMRAKGGLSSLTCLALITWWLLLPKTVFASIEAMSEPIYVLLSYGALTTIARMEGHRRVFPAAVALVVLCTLTRTIGVTLLVAFLLQFYREVPRRTWILTAAVCGMPMILWSVVSTTYFGAGRVYIGEPSDYFTGLSLQNALLNLFVNWPSTFVDAWLGQFQMIDIPAAKTIYMALLLLAIIGLLGNLLRGAVDAIYVALYLLVIWLWPYPDHVHRFLWPLMPALLFYAAEAASTLASRMQTNMCVARTAAVVIMMTVAVANWFVLVQRFAKEVPEDMTMFRGSRFNLRTDSADEARTGVVLFRALSDTLGKVGAMVPENECIIASNRDLMMLFGRRPSVFPPLPALDDKTFRARLECRFLFVQKLMSNPYLPPDYPAGRVDSKRVLARFEVPALPQPIEVGTLYELSYSD